MSIAPARKPRVATAAPLFDGQSSQSAPACLDDFVEDLGVLVQQLVPGAKPEVVAAIKAQVRERWGGDRPYIARRLGEGRSERNQAIRADFQRGERVAFLMRRYCLSRMQIYRILGLPGE